MKNVVRIGCVAIVVVMVSTTNLCAQRTVANFSRDWRFAKGQQEDNVTQMDFGDSRHCSLGRSGGRTGAPPRQTLVDVLWMSTEGRNDDEILFQTRNDDHDRCALVSYRSGKCTAADGEPGSWGGCGLSVLFTAEGCSSNNGSKSTPALSADLLGDWREEILWRSRDNKELRLHTTTIPTSHRFRTLMHDPQYRLSIAWQNVAYNQPPHVGFFLGAGMDTPSRPNIMLVGNGK